MSRTSKAIHASLMRSVRDLDAEQQFTQVQQRYPALVGFVDPESLIDYLRSKDEDLDKKDVVIGLLVRIVQSHGAGAPLASSLLWLGMWPSLEGILSRRASLFPGSPEELVSEIADCFTSVVESLDFGLVRRVAATLARSTEREIVRRRLRVWLEESRRADLPGESELGVVDPVEPREPPLPSRFGLGENLPDEEAVAELRSQIAPITGDENVDLVIDAVVRGQDQHQLAERFGLTHEAARKRVQRALWRLRNRLGRRKPGGASLSKRSPAPRAEALP